jgi:hypothetical protein
MKPTFLFIFLVAGSLFAEIDSSLEDKAFYLLPEGTQIQFKFKKDITVEPNSTHVYLPVYEEDADGDGIADSDDWCPNTPKGAKIWTEERIKTENKPGNFLGCSFTENSKETWLPKDNGPKGYEYKCALFFPASKKNSDFAKDSIFTVKGKISLTNKEFNSTYFSDPTDYAPKLVHNFLTIKTKSGLEFLLKCDSGYNEQRIESGDILAKKYTVVPTTIKQLNTYFILSNIPKP